MRMNIIKNNLENKYFILHAYAAVVLIKFLMPQKFEVEPQSYAASTDAAIIEHSKRYVYWRNRNQRRCNNLLLPSLS